MIKTILFLADSSLGYKFWNKFSAQAQIAIGAKTVGLCLHEPQMKFYSKEGNSFESIYFAGNTLNNYGQYEIDYDATKHFLEVFETVNNTLIVDLLQVDRHLGKGFQTGGTRHPGSLLQDKANYWDSARVIQEYIIQFRLLFDKIKPDLLVLPGIAGMPSKLLCLCAKEKKIPIRVLYTGKIGNRYVWSEDEYYTVPRLQDIMNNTDLKTERVELDSHLFFKKILKDYKQYVTIRGLLSGVISETKSYLFKKAVQIRDQYKRVEEYKYSTNLQYRVNIYQDYKTLLKYVNRYKKDGDLRYFYYPMHDEPEAALMTMSPYFTNQAALIDFVARSLPVGVMLVVKENFIALGRRPKDYYKWLASIPNVVIVSPFDNSLTLSKNSIATVTITGTAGMEAALMGVQVITFGHKNIYNIMKHVHYVSDHRLLRDLIAKVISDYYDEHKLSFRLEEGKRFFSALMKSTFDLGDELLEGSKEKALSDQAVEKIFDHLMNSL